MPSTSSKALLVFLCFFLPCSCVSRQTMLSLIGDSGWQSLTSSSDTSSNGCHWQVRSSNGSVRVPATVPGQIHLDLERAGVIGNTYYRFNAAENAWVKKDSWIFETKFTLSADLATLVDAGPSHGEVWLVFDGIDTIADVFVDEPVPQPVEEPMDCFTKHVATLPDPRTPYFKEFQSSTGLAGCAQLCLADDECGGFTVAPSHSGPSSSHCWTYHRPADTPTSNGTGFNDADWYSRLSTHVRCRAHAPTSQFSTSDQFLRYSFPVGSILRHGAGPHGVHTLAVHTKSVAQFEGGPTKWGPVRKEPSNFGYDWSPKVDTQGIWLPVYLVGQAKLLLIDMVATVIGAPSNPSERLTSQTAHFHVSVAARVNLTVSGEFSYRFEGNWSGSDSKVAGKMILPAGVSTITAVLNASGEDIELWWPNGAGSQPLYEVKFNVVSNDVIRHSFGSNDVSASRRIGFRTVNINARLGTTTDPPVQTYRVNGVDIFAKGADWVPPDSFEARTNDGTLCSLLQSARDSNMNFLRIWGGGIYPQDGFFDCADELGILLEQDEIFSNTRYPTDATFLGLIAEEVQYQARRLAHHPSLFLWSGSNEIEPEAAGQWWDIVFLDTVFPNISVVDKTRPVWPACPAYPWATGVDAGGLPNGDPFMVSERHGPTPPAEVHSYWFGMCRDPSPCLYCQDDSFYATTVFASEFGWVGMPSLESLIPVLGAPKDDYTLTSAAMRFRQNTAFHQDQVYNWVQWNFGSFASPYINSGDAASFRKAIYMSQVAQTDCLRAEAEHYRRGRDSAAKTGGSLFWMLDDNWPVPSWTSLEYGGRRKLLHYEATRFYSPVAMSSYCLPSISNCSSVVIHITSDLAQPLPENATLIADMTRWADGATVPVLSKSIKIGSSSGVTAKFESGAFSAGLRAAGCASIADCFLTTRLANGVGGQSLAPDNQQWLTPWRSAKLRKAVLKIEAEAAGSNGEVALTITSDNVAPLVMVHCGEPTDFGWFDDNGLLVMPGHPIKLRYTPRSGPSSSNEHRPCTADGAGFYAVSTNGASASIGQLRGSSIGSVEPSSEIVI